MKNRSTLLLILSVLITSTLFGQMKESMEIFFPTTGNCVLCKIRIENAVSKLNGIEEVLWDAVDDITYVTYDDTQIDAYQIMEVISYVGHETEWYPASDSAYASLQGTCCYYTKVIDYTNVQVGYLGMMGIWVWQLTGIDNPELNDVKILPGSGDGMLTISGKELSTYGNITIEAYTVNGQRLHQEVIDNADHASIDLRHLSSGCYVIALSANGRLIHRSKVYKH